METSSQHYSRIFLGLEEPEEKMPSLCMVADSNSCIQDLHTLAHLGTYSLAMLLVRNKVAKFVAMGFSANQGSPYDLLQSGSRNQRATHQKNFLKMAFFEFRCFACLTS